MTALFQAQFKLISARKPVFSKIQDYKLQKLQPVHTPGE